MCVKSATMEKSTRIPVSLLSNKIAAPNHRHVQRVSDIGENTQQQVSLLLSPVHPPGSGARVACRVRGEASCVRQQFHWVQVWRVKQMSTTS